MPATAPDAKQRFSDRVDDYVRYRPTYPREILDRVLAGARVSPPARVADVGSGTGISSEWLLSAGLDVWAVEPNAQMREAAERGLSAIGGPRYRSVPGSAEATTLPGSSVDLVVCAQAFHWFDPVAARREFARILRGSKPVALVWNDRQLGGSPFLDGYEDVLRTLGTEYARATHHNITAADDRFKSFFAGPFELIAQPTHQLLNETALLGRAFSSSYTPKPGDPERPRMEHALRDLFHRTQQGGTVRLEYITQAFVGRVD